MKARHAAMNAIYSYTRRRGFVPAMLALSPPAYGRLVGEMRQEFPPARVLPGMVEGAFVGGVLVIALPTVSES